jgi:hypothetical protein
MSANAERAQICAVTEGQAATLLNVSRRSIQHAGVVLALGVPELIAAVESGEIAVSLASEIARAPADAQRAALAAGWAAQKALAKQIKQQRHDKRHAEEREAWRIACEERGGAPDA